MIRNIIILALLIAAALTYTWLDGHMQTVPDAPPPASSVSLQTQRQTAPDFTFETTAGKKHSLSDFAGKPVVLNFWATWCAPCVVEFPAMLKLAQKTDAVFIFMSQDESNAEIRRFITRYGEDLPLENVYIARDEDKKTAQQLYQTFKLPETYLIGHDQTIVEKIIGLIEWNDESMVRRIRSLEE